jgi:hypothetical protein
MPRASASSARTYTKPIALQAKENVRKAIETRNLAERQNWLGEALRYVT